MVNDQIETISLSEYQALTRKRAKHGNRKVQDGAFTFDSEAEWRHWKYDLLIQEAAHLIWDLKLQVPLLLAEGFRNRRGKKVQPIYYYADFVYKTDNDLTTVVDVKPLVKGQRSGKTKYSGLTEAFRLKWKIAQARYPDYDFQIVRL